eukprot:scaffold7914_cov118-Isochrysis_galbana.AAC.5
MPWPCPGALAGRAATAIERGRGCEVEGGPSPSPRPWAWGLGGLFLQPLRAGAGGGGLASEE